MNITLSPGELKEFASRIEKWYSDRGMIIVNLLIDSVKSGKTLPSISEAVNDRMLKFDEENPKPDWRNLL